MSSLVSAAPFTRRFRARCAAFVAVTSGGPRTARERQRRRRRRRRRGSVSRRRPRRSGCLTERRGPRRPLMMIIRIPLCSRIGKVRGQSSFHHERPAAGRRPWPPAPAPRRSDRIVLCKARRRDGPPPGWRGAALAASVNYLVTAPGRFNRKGENEIVHEYRYYDSPLLLWDAAMF